MSVPQALVPSLHSFLRPQRKVRRSAQAGKESSPTLKGGVNPEGFHVPLSLDIGLK